MLCPEPNWKKIKSQSTLNLSNAWIKLYTWQNDSILDSNISQLIQSFYFWFYHAIYWILFCIDFKSDFLRFNLFQVLNANYLIFIKMQISMI